ncbi:MAG: hypothetical protein ACK4G5_03035, partial [Devosia sp.]
MPLATGRSYLAIPGPSVSPERVLNAMHRTAPNIYEGELVDMTRALIPDLKRVAQTDQHVAIYIANGHGAWEAANANMFSRGDRALLAATGRFGHGWAEGLTRMGVTVDIIDFGKAAPADPARIADALQMKQGVAQVRTSHRHGDPPFGRGLRQRQTFQSKACR